MITPPLLLIGGRGMLGQAMTAALAARGLAHAAPARPDMDLLRPETLARAVPHGGTGSRSPHAHN